MTTDRARLAERVAALDPARRSAVRKLLVRDKAGRDATGPLPRHPPGSPAPLSFGQRRLWVIHRMAPEDIAYNETNLLPFHHPVDPAALEWALRELGRRHEVLRSRFHLEGDEPVQTPMPTLDIELPVHDLRHLPPDQRPAAADRIASERGRIPFDLATSPPIRAALVRLEPNDNLLVLVIHHIAVDGWSLGLLVIELLALYWSRATGKPSPLPEVQLQFGDYALWQRRILTTETEAPHLERWRRHLAGVERIELPADRPRPPQPSLRGGRVPLDLPGELDQGLAALARAENTSITVVTLAALFALLHRQTGEEDLTIGSPSSGRHVPGLEGLVGFLINTLVLRVRVGGELRFSELVELLADEMTSALGVQDIPLEWLIEQLSPARDRSPVPFFQIMFQMFDASNLESLPPELRMRAEPVDTGAAKFDLTVQFIHSSFGTRGHLEYNADLFDKARIERLGQQLLRILECVAADPATQVRALPLLAAEEERRMLVDWNATEAEFDREAFLDEIVRGHARARPDAIAVRCDGSAQTYAELAGEAGHIRDLLRQAGVGRGDRVGVHFSRSLGLPAILLGILESGAAYVPIDPRWPAERTQLLLAEAGVAVVLAEESDAPGLAKFAGTTLVPEMGGGGAGAAIESPAGRSAEDAAYVMFTSGTSGDPKGVLVSHRNVVRLIRDPALFDPVPGQVGMLFAPLFFDASVLELWGCLGSGGTLVIHPPGLPSLGDLGAFIEEKGVDTAFLTTALCRQMIEDHPRRLRKLKRLLTGGEAMDPTMATAAWQALPRTQVVNCYGPTECGVVATAWLLDGSERERPRVPIGRPLANMRAYVVDRYDNPVPVGVVGELLVGGEGVAIGYLKKPGDGDSRFVDDRFSPRPGARLYRTGDMVAWTEDGVLEFHGRRDRQLKLSGYRIEPGEIEAAAMAHPRVSLAAAFIAPGPTARLALVATPAAGSTVTPGELHRFLAERLPPQLVPGRIEIHDSLPLSGSGKVDVEAIVLAEPDPATSARPAPPRTATEKAVAMIWRQLLERDDIGTEDNFFDLGGHSLLAMRVLSRVRDALGTDIAMAAFFDAPTVRGLAGIIDGGARP